MQTKQAVNLNDNFFGQGADATTKPTVRINIFRELFDLEHHFVDAMNSAGPDDYVSETQMNELEKFHERFKELILDISSDPAFNPPKE